MGIDSSLLVKLRLLPAEQQREVLDFVDFLASRVQRERPRRSLAGLWSGFDVSAEDLEQARRELWGGFPREAP